MRAMVLLLLALLPLAGLAAGANASAAATGQSAMPEAGKYHIPVTGAGQPDSIVNMVTLVYLPAQGQPPYPVVVFSHGRAGSQAERLKLSYPVSKSQIAYWTGKGFAVVAPIRPGYGETGGQDQESSGQYYGTHGECGDEKRLDYHAAEAQVVKVTQAALDWVKTQPWARPSGIVLAGQSMGGFTSAAVAATRPEGVAGYINFAGGSGGNPERSPGRMCHPEALQAMFAEWGKRTRMPSLWIYAENDQYWGPEAPVAWHAAFSAGGSPTRLVHAPPVPDGDGHGLSRHAARYWSGWLDEFLATIGY